MAHLWFSNVTGQWNARPLVEGAGALVPVGEELDFVPAAGVSSHPASPVRLVHLGPAGGRSSWVLLAGSEASVRINGDRLLLGLRALRDQDEISMSNQRWFFSTEPLACVRPFSGSAEPAFCPRCKERLEVGDPAVACPHCHAWHHQSEKLPCWTYHSTCALCQHQLTALDAGFAWTPQSF